MVFIGGIITQNRVHGFCSKRNGHLQNKLWQNWAVNISLWGKRLHFFFPTEATVMGNIAVQLIALGELSSWRDARRVITDSTPLKIYEPEESAAWDEAYAEYVKYLGKSAKK